LHIISFGRSDDAVSGVAADDGLMEQRMTRIGRVAMVLRGQAVPYTRPDTRSAIAKQAVSGPVAVTLDGLDGDEQGDRRVHGGPDKAIHHYAFEHYPVWRGELGALPVLAAPGAFGENLSTSGCTEADICIGDRLRIGTALLEVSQSRQPCWKLNDRFGRRDMARRVQETGRTGWYYRVIETGELQAGDAITLAVRPHPGWTLARLIATLYRNTLDIATLKAMLALPLTPSWRKLIDGRLAQGTVEDWMARLDGPAISGAFD
jgi:MOSC domain-containing protein YiiM